MKVITYLKFVIKKLIGENEKVRHLSRNVHFIGSCKPQLSIGEYTSINGLKIYCWDSNIRINMGKFCSIADEVMIIAGGEHDIDWVTSYPIIDVCGLTHLFEKKKPRWKGPILIGNDVWIANRATILSGVTIGDGAVIGACSVVSKDIPPYAVVAGNPAQILYYRFDEKQILALRKIKWWEWTEEQISNRFADFFNIEEFINKYLPK